MVDIHIQKSQQDNNADSVGKEDSMLKYTSANVCKFTSERMPAKNSTSRSLSNRSTLSLLPNEFATVFRASEL